MMLVPYAYGPWGNLPPPPPELFKQPCFGQKAGNIRANHLNFVQAMDKNIRARDFSPAPQPPPKLVPYTLMVGTKTIWRFFFWHDVSLDSSLHILILYVIALFSILIKTGCPQMEIARWKLIRFKHIWLVQYPCTWRDPLLKSKRKNMENTVPSHNNNIYMHHVYV